ncbi:MAG: hypothetical protein LBM01_04150 [Christensenellaceae bacterium]|jgi:hypothetical protein|nr:hypothetical protein [Christensenellaceae bacterium]
MKRAKRAKIRQQLEGISEESFIEQCERKTQIRESGFMPTSFKNLFKSPRQRAKADADAELVGFSEIYDEEGARKYHEEFYADKWDYYKNKVERDAEMAEIMARNKKYDKFDLDLL